VLFYENRSTRDIPAWLTYSSTTDNNRIYIYILLVAYI
jgi:hypothetical protein